MSISDSIKNKNRRIATNSILLFARMIVVMLINLFTMRWILRGLGFQDYGIYAAVTGMVTVCSCIGNVLTLGTQRFYSYALGEHNDRKMKEIFTISTHLVIGLSFGLVLVYEIIGPWFISNHLSLPPLRVGRNGEEAFCLLVYNEETSEEKIERLKFLETTSDGFKIAEQDMLLRGPGDYLGIEQSGFPTFNSLNIVSDYKMFEVSKNEINYILENESNLENSNYINRIKEKMIKKASELSLIEEI